MLKKMLFLTGSILLGLSFVVGASGYWQSTSDPNNPDYANLKSLKVFGTVGTHISTWSPDTVENTVYNSKQ